MKNKTITQINIHQSGKRNVIVKFKDETGHVISTGKARCHKDDMPNFNILTGARLAFDRAEKKITPPIEVGDMVILKEGNRCITTYENWVNENLTSSQALRYAYGREPIKYFNGGKIVYKVIKISEHLKFPEYMLYAIESTSGEIYIVEEEGIERI